MQSIDIVIFSKDRPIQLYALLESFSKFCLDKDLCNINILYKESNEFNGIYDDIKFNFNNINLIKENYFYQDFSKLMMSIKSKYLMFLVDDIIFKDYFNIIDAINILENDSNIMTFSLRLGNNINYCYPISSYISAPELKQIYDNIISWDIDYTKEDWGYPFSMDGNIFRSEEFKNICYCQYMRPFNSPNQLESFLSLIHIQNKKMASFNNSKLLNVPDNRVQDHFQNKNEGGDFREMISKWNDGYKIDINKIYEIQNNSCHFPIKLGFIKR